MITKPLQQKQFYIKRTELKIRLQTNELDTGIEGPEIKILKSKDGKVVVGLDSGDHRFVSP
jgi:hypothetical protein